MNTRSWRVLVPSCDAYSDTWPIFFHFLFSQWQDVPSPITLVSNQRTYADERVQTLRTGKDESWAGNLIKALDQIPEPHVLLVLDDFLLDQPVETRWIDSLCQELEARKGHYLNCAQTPNDPSTFHQTQSYFIPATKENGCGTLQLALWKKDRLREFCLCNGNIWDIETAVRRRVEAEEYGFFCLDSQAPFRFSYNEAIRGRFWKPSGVEFLKKHGITPDLWYRPCPIQGRDPLSKLCRSFLKRGMQMRIALEAKLKTQPIVHPLRSCS